MTTDDALIAEARARASAEAPDWAERWTTIFTRHLIALVREDWRPEPEVDAVTLAAREWVASANQDATHTDAFRAGHAHALANHPDVKRMDWLEGLTVDVYGGDGPAVRHGVYTREPDSLRAKIDRAMEGGE